ncbi:hypothetical protein CEUSTIGMA_g8658.t1 [Chlamydomonas eustigma]|uniref:Uncharacterized protein n=1 Tax=Chlamydomonas eustigma TaxID=1157962 RepID=A0A250XDU7_9CHLO|nr:hypothetical protein CEUSTIGMA_g8658.t1 [Chlamydomonas eustigma]|eukprot:GAX81226.1 hypothetical protein CEUSTIGMA_g8658.t1 [Chlamydomonas eustigma]
MSAKKVNDIQTKLSMSLDDLIASKKKAPTSGIPKAKGGRAPISMKGNAKMARESNATGIAAKRLAMKARRAVEGALANNGKSAPKQLTKSGGVKKAGPKGTSVRPKMMQTNMAKRILSRARANKQLTMAPKLTQKAPRMTGHLKMGIKKGVGALATPKFLPGGKKNNSNNQLGGMQQPTSAARRMRLQRQQQQQQVGGAGRKGGRMQQGRAGGKQGGRAPLHTQVMDAGRNLNRTQGGVRKGQQQQQQRRQNNQQRAPINLSRGTRPRGRQQQAVFQQYRGAAPGGSIVAPQYFGMQAGSMPPVFGGAPSKSPYTNYDPSAYAAAYQQMYMKALAQYQRQYLPGPGQGGRAGGKDGRGGNRRRGGR